MLAEAFAPEVALVRASAEAGWQGAGAVRATGRAASAPPPWWEGAAGGGAVVDRLHLAALRPQIRVLGQTVDLGLQVGRDLHRWGPGALGTFVLSENAGPLDAVRVAVAGDRLRGLKLLAPLEEGRWLHGLRYDWLPTANLRVGLSETVVSASGVYAPYVLTPVPLVAYWLVLRARGPAGFNDNVNLAVDLDWRVRPGVALYAEGYVDDYTAPGNPFPSRLGGTVGLYLADPFRDGGTTLRLEHARTTNWTYTTTDRAADYTVGGRSLGHWCAPDCEVWAVEVERTWPAPRARPGVVTLTVRYALVRKGPGRLGDVWTDPGDAWARLYLSGVVETTHALAAGVRWQPADALSHRLTATWSSTINAGHGAGVSWWDLSVKWEASLGL